MFTLVFFILLFLALSALFSGTEIAFISASKLRVELNRKKGSNRGMILADFYKKPADFLSTMLVGNNIALVVFTTLMTQLLTPIVSPYLQNEIGQLLLFTLITTIIILIFGEFMPKTLFRLYANDVLYFLAYPLKVLRYILVLPAWFMIKLSNAFIGLIVREPVEEVGEAFTRLDLENFIKTSRPSTPDEDIDTDLFEKALNLRDVRVKDCMIPRPEIQYIDVKDSLEELEQRVKSTNLSRLIVTRNNDIDEVLGYVHHQQLLKQPSSIQEIILDIFIVPESMRVNNLLSRFIKQRLSIACVVDEFGGTSGVVTLEDILEEIFGEIEDEHDQEEHLEEQISENEFIFSGRLEISYLNEKYGLDFPEGEYHTLSGYLVMTQESIPEQNEKIKMDGYKFVLELVSDKKIETIRVIGPSKLEEEEEAK